MGKRKEILDIYIYIYNLKSIKKFKEIKTGSYHKVVNERGGRCLANTTLWNL